MTSRCFNKVVSLSTALIYYSYNIHCEPLMVSASSNDSTANNFAEYDNQGLWSQHNVLSKKMELTNA